MIRSLQMSPEIPFSLSLNLKNPLYFQKRNIKCGIISQVALRKGEHSLQAIHKHDLVHEITDKYGGKFEIELKRNKSGFKLQRVPKLIKRDSRNDFRIDGVGKSGWSLRKAQIGAVYSLLSHWLHIPD